MGDVSEVDLMYLRQAIALAWQAREQGCHPFGCLIVDELGETVTVGLNNAVLPKGDPTQHAELVACAASAIQGKGAVFDAGRPEGWRCL